LTLESHMYFREKTAWAALISILVGFGTYFATLAYGQATGRATPDYYAGLLVVVVLCVTIAMAIFGIVSAIRTPEEARALADERDRAIDARATRAAYFVLLIGTLSSAAAAWLGGLFWVLNGLLASIVLAEVIRYGTMIRHYRRA